MIYFRRKAEIVKLFPYAGYAAYFLFSNPYTHFPRKNKARKMTELILQVNGYAQKITRMSGIK